MRNAPPDCRRATPSRASHPAANALRQQAQGRSASRAAIPLRDSRRSSGRRPTTRPDGRTVWSRASSHAVHRRAESSVCDIVEPSLRLFLQAPVEEFSDSLRSGRREGVPVRLALEHRRQVSVRSRHRTRGASEHFVEHAPERPDVGALVHGLPRACSGHMYAAVPRIMPACVIAAAVIVGESAIAPGIRSAERLGQSEVEHLDRAVGVAP